MRIVGYGRRFFQVFACFVVLATTCGLRAQSPLLIYTDHLVNSFADWSWGTRNLANTSPVHSGSDSVSVSAQAWQAFSVWHDDLNAGSYSTLTFWANGGSTGGQILQVYVEYGSSTGPHVQLATLPANAWHFFQIPLTQLGVATATNFNRIVWLLTASGTSGTFYIDDIQLAAKPASLVHLAVNAAAPLRTADARWFGVNTAVWDNSFDNSTTVSFLREMRASIMRFPGGSLSDQYHWSSNKSGTNTFQWFTSFANFTHVATNVGAQAMITVNYGSGTAAEAAGWVRHSNVTNHLGFKYWEIGNEIYGTWETDTNRFPHDPYTYAVRAADYFNQMKAADPSIRIGFVAAPGEESYSNGYSSHPALNPRTGQTHYGWVPVMLVTLKGLGITPDFLVHHRYPEFTDPTHPSNSDSDPFLLQCSTAWFNDAAQLRQEISDYFGPAGTNIELLCSENNSDAGAQGRQSTSLVNAVYYADSLAQLMKTEFNSFIWWDLRNSTDKTGCFDPELYGWRTYGDLGMINGLSTRHPTFYAAKLMRSFVAPGEQVVSASSDYPLLSAYAARHTDGSVSLLVLNKDPATNFTAQISVNGFVPDTVGTIRSYGIPQDQAARANGSASAQDVSTNVLGGVSGTFTYTFAPLSINLLTLVPDSPQLVLVRPAAPGAGLTLQLHGQPGVSYIVQSSSDLQTWLNVSTNTLSTDTLNLAYPVSGGPLYWRALWRP